MSVGVVQLPGRPGIWLGWIAANAAGYAAGMAVWQLVFPAVRLPLSRPLGGSLNAALFGATLGVFVGLAQAMVLRGRTAGMGAWIAATAAGAAAGLLAGAWAGYLLSLAFAAAGAVVYISDGTEVLSFGLVLGAGMGTAQWLILRRREQPAGRWLLASGVGLMIGYAAATGIFELLPPLGEPLLGALLGACAGAIAAAIGLLFVERALAPSAVSPSRAQSPHG